MQKNFKIFMAIMTVLWAIGIMGLAPAQAATIVAGDLIKASLPAVYYYAADGKRYVFPNETTYKTWYQDFSGVKQVTDTELAAITIGGNVTFRPGVKLAKITTDPKVYAVDKGGILRWVTTAEVASALYGANWSSLIQDVSDAFFVNYNVGAPIYGAADYNPATATAAATTIWADRTVSVPTGGALTVSLAADTPSASALVVGTTLDFTKLNLTAGDTAVSIKSMYISRFGLSANTDVNNIKLINNSGQQVGTTADLSSVGKALITFSPALTINAKSTMALKIRASVVNTATVGSTIALGINSASDIEVVLATISGSFPVRGSYMTGSSETSSTTMTPPEGILIGGRAKQGVASFKVTAGQAEDIDLNSVTITDTGTGKVATAWYLYSAQRSDGVSVSEPIAIGILDPVTKKVQFLITTGTVIIKYSQSVTLTVAVDAAPIDGVTVQNGDSLKAIVAAGTDIEATGKASGQKIYGLAVTDTKTYYTLGSYPYFKLSATSPKQTLVPGGNTLLAIYEVTADPADEVDFLSAANNTSGIANKLKVNISHSCVAGLGSGMVLKDENGTVLDTQAVDVCAANTVTFTFGNPGNFQIGPGATKKLYIYADTSGATTSGNSIQLYLDGGNPANLDFAINGTGNYAFSQYIFANGIYANALAR